MIPERRLERTPATPKTGASHRHLKPLKNNACMPSRLPENDAWDGASGTPEYGAWNDASGVPENGIAGPPRMRLTSHLKHAWNSAANGAANGAWTGAWRALRTALLRALNDTSWMSETAPNGAPHRHRKCHLVTGSDAQNETTLGRHRSSRRCKEDTVPSFYALRLVFIFRFSPIRFGETN